MNYYQHHIGDFDRATRHLTRLERSIYRDLIELYYDTEQPLTLDRAALCRKIIARSNEEATAVEQTLSEFFTETATGWYHERCETEIGRYHNSTSQKAVAGKASALKRAAKKQEALSGDSTVVEQPLNGESTNQEPLTINQEPVKPLRKKSAPMPSGFILNEVSTAYAITRNLNITDEIVSFTNWHTAKGSTFKDWQAAWRTWCDKAVEFGRAKGGGTQTAPTKQSNRDSYDAQAKAAQARLNQESHHDNSTERDITGTCTVVA